MSKKKITLDQIIEVLSFYADETKYGTVYIKGSMFDKDRGKRARKILKPLVLEIIDETNKN